MKMRNGTAVPEEAVSSRLYCAFVMKVRTAYGSTSSTLDPCAGLKTLQQVSDPVQVSDVSSPSLTPVNTNESGDPRVDFKCVEPSDEPLYRILDWLRFDNLTAEVG